MPDWAQYQQDPHYQEASRAIIAGTARAELASRFESAGLTHEQLAERVGHSPRNARRVVEGKEGPSEPTVAVYFRALAAEEDAHAPG